MSNIKKLLLIIFIFLFSNNKSYTYTRTQKFCDEPVLIEIVTAKHLIGRDIIETAAKETEDISLREIVLVTYLEDGFGLISEKDGKARSIELMKRFQTRGLPLVLLNGQFLFQGFGGDEEGDNILEKLKIYYKKLFLRETSKIPYDESFILKEVENIERANKLKVKLEAIRDFKEKELSKINVVIFLIVDPLPSCYFKDVNHRNVAFKFIPIEGLEYGEFNGIGIPIEKIIEKDFISRGDDIIITTTNFVIDEKFKQASWSVIVIIENAEKKLKIFSRKFKLNNN